MSAWWWIAIGVAGLAISVLVSLLIGRFIRRGQDDQRRTDEDA